MLAWDLSELKLRIVIIQSPHYPSLVLSPSTVMAPSIHSASMVKVLRDIMERATTMKEMLEATGTCRPPVTVKQFFNLKQLVLPYPADIVASIDALSLPENVSNRIQKQVAITISKTQQFLFQSYEKACCEARFCSSDEAHFEKLRTFYQAAYQRHFLQRIRQEILRIQPGVDIHRKPSEKKPAFNSARVFVVLVFPPIDITTGFYSPSRELFREGCLSFHRRTIGIGKKDNDDATSN